jgi:hypothetical protein
MPDSIWAELAGAFGRASGLSTQGFGTCWLGEPPLESHHEIFVSAIKVAKGRGTDKLPDRDHPDGPFVPVSHIRRCDRRLLNFVLWTEDPT